MTIPPAGQAPAPAPGADPTGPAPAALPAPPAGNTSPPWDRDGQPFDPARAWALIENLRADLAAARGGQAPTDTAPPAAPADPPAPVTSPEPRTPPADAGLSAQLDALRAQLARERAGRRHGLDDDLVDLLGTGTDEQIEARAAALAARLAPAGTAPAPTSPVPRRPVEQLHGGGDPTTTPEETDPRKLADLIRSRSQF